MAWSTSNRRDQLPPGWGKIRARILQRDGHQCTHTRYDTGARCSEVATEVDHIVPGNDHSDTNLRALCRYHHGQKSSREGAAGRARVYRPSRRRPADDHPAAIDLRPKRRRR